MKDEKNGLKKTEELVLKKGKVNVERKLRAEGSVVRMDHLHVKIEQIDIEENRLLVSYEFGQEKKEIWVTEDQERNKQYKHLQSSIRSLQVGDPIALHWLNRVDKEQSLYYYGYFVFYPRIQLQASKIANAAKSDNFHQLHPIFYWANGYTTIDRYMPLIRGNIINNLFDNLFLPTNEKKSFSEVMFQSMRDNIWNILNMSEEDRMAINKDLKALYHKMESFVTHEGYTQNLENVYIEPSFASDDFGLYGRLDFLNILSNDQQIVSEIIELKSGSLPFTRNPAETNSKIKLSHQIQVKLYDLMIRNIYELGSKQTSTAVLYSSNNKAPIVSHRKLNLAPFQISVGQLIGFRNQIILLIKGIVFGYENNAQLFLEDSIAKAKVIVTNPEYKGSLSWMIRDIQTMLDMFEQKNELIKKYIQLQNHFVFSEYWFSNPYFLNKKKNENFNEPLNQLEGLTIAKIEDKNLSDISFERLSKINTITFSLNSNKGKIIEHQQPEFRVGDSVSLRKVDLSREVQYDYQLITAEVAALDMQFIKLKFLIDQPLQYFYDRIQKQFHSLTWKITPKYFENQFSSGLQNIYRFSIQSEDRKEVILGLRPPKSIINIPVTDFIGNEELLKQSREDYNRVIAKALSIQDYLLVSGPPGTGKTKMFIKYLTQAIERSMLSSFTLAKPAKPATPATPATPILEKVTDTTNKLQFGNKTKAILIVAYTHRALDELCETLLDVDSLYPYLLRIGYNKTGNEKIKKISFNDHLRSQPKSKLDEIKEFIKSKKIIFSTVVSLNKYQSIFENFDFEYAIIDEASQILESQILGLLSQAKKFVMIGDAKQLPAVSVTDEEHFKNHGPRIELLETIINFKSTKISYFERMYKLAHEKGWNNSLDALIYQGRMHPKIMDFPNKFFYDGKLKVAGLRHQKINQFFEKPQHRLNERMIIIPCVDQTKKHPKVNEKEAEVIAKTIEGILGEIVNIDGEINRLQAEDIGVIAPFRAQVAQITSVLHDNIGEQHAKRIIVDTVERFQGSQKRIIIFSLTIHHPNHFAWIKSESDPSNPLLDKKLNVAITRAKDVFICVGDTNVMRQDVVYNELMKRMKGMEN